MDCYAICAKQGRGYLLLLPCACASSCMRTPSYARLHQSGAYVARCQSSCLVRSDLSIVRLPCCHDKQQLTHKLLHASREPPEDGLMCEMLWSDPKPAEGRGPSQRGVGVGFGPDVTRNFLQDNKLDLLVRSHEVRPPTDCLCGQWGCVQAYMLDGGVDVLLL